MKKATTYDAFTLFLIVELFEDTNALLSDEIKEIGHDTAYLSELLVKFNEMNLQWQGNEINLF